MTADKITSRDAILHGVMAIVFAAGLITIMQGCQLERTYDDARRGEEAGLRQVDSRYVGTWMPLQTSMKSVLERYYRIGSIAGATERYKQKGLDEESARRRAVADYEEQDDPYIKEDIHPNDMPKLSILKGGSFRIHIREQVLARGRWTATGQSDILLQGASSSSVAKLRYDAASGVLQGIEGDLRIPQHALVADYKWRKKRTQ